MRDRISQGQWLVARDLRRTMAWRIGLTNQSEAAPTSGGLTRRWACAGLDLRRWWSCSRRAAVLPAVPWAEQAVGPPVAPRRVAVPPGEPPAAVRLPVAVAP